MMVRFDLKIFLDNTGMRAGDQRNFICLFKAFQMEIMDYGTCILPPVSQSASFKYVGVFFDARLRWGAEARYFYKKSLQRLIF
jgi:hypothetical protein